MRLFLFVLLSLSTALFAQSTRIEEVAKSPVEAKFASGGKIRMELCSSGIELTGRDEGVVRVSYHPDHASVSGEDVRVRLRISGSEADLRVTRCPHNNFRMTIEVPKSSDLYVRMFAGELNVTGITGNKDVQLHFGQLTMDIGEPASYSRVQASVNSGDLEARAFSVSKGGLFRSFERTGQGKYRLYAHVGAGELDLN
jgi:hypothetical protein